MLFLFVFNICYLYAYLVKGFPTKFKRKNKLKIYIHLLLLRWHLRSCIHLSSKSTTSVNNWWMLSDDQVKRNKLTNKKLMSFYFCMVFTEPRLAAKRFDTREDFCVTYLVCNATEPYQEHSTLAVSYRSKTATNISVASSEYIRSQNLVDTYSPS